MKSGTKLVVACDHRGFEAKQRLLPQLEQMGCEVIDLGCDGPTGVDYPDFAAPAARLVAAGKADCALLLDGSGIGMCIVANKIKGVRAAQAHDEITARIAREHNHCNVLCVGTDLIGERTLRDIVATFLKAELGGGRHMRRIGKIAQIESEEVAAGTLDFALPGGVPTDGAGDGGLDLPLAVADLREEAPESVIRAVRRPKGNGHGGHTFTA